MAEQVSAADRPFGDAIEGNLGAVGASTWVNGGILVQGPFPKVAGQINLSLLSVACHHRTFRLIAEHDAPNLYIYPSRERHA